MSDYRPKVGHRVKVTLEGEVTFVSAAIPNAFALGDDASVQVYPGRGVSVSVERLADPYPPVGSLVQSISGAHFLRISEGWVSVRSGDTYDHDHLKDAIDQVTWQPEGD